MSRGKILKEKMEIAVLDYRNSVRTRAVNREKLSNERLGYLSSRIGDYKKKRVENYKGRKFKSPDAKQAKSICRALVYLCPTAEQVESASEMMHLYGHQFAPGYILLMTTKSVFLKIPLETILKTCESPEAIVNYVIYGQPTPNFVEALSRPFDRTDYLTFLSNKFAEFDEQLGLFVDQAGFIGFTEDCFLNLETPGYLPPNINWIYPDQSILKIATWDMFSKMGMFRNALDYERRMKSFEERVNRYDKVLSHFQGKALSNKENDFWSRPKFLQEYKSLYVKLIETVGPLAKRDVETKLDPESIPTVEFDIPQYNPIIQIQPARDPLEVAMNTRIDSHPEDLITNLRWKGI